MTQLTSPIQQIRLGLRTYTMVLALIAIWIVFQIQTDGAFLEPRNLSNLLRQMSVTGILAGGMVLVIVSGHVDLSVGSMAAFLGGILAVLSTQHGLDPVNALSITMASGLLFGLIQGYLVAYQRIPAFIVTLGGMMAFRGGAMWVTESSTIPIPENWILHLATHYLPPSVALWIVGGGLLTYVSAIYRSRKFNLAHGLPSRRLFSQVTQVVFVTVASLGAAWIFHSYEGVPIPVLCMFVILLLMSILALKTVWGRQIFAIGGNVEAAFMSGINVESRLLSAFALMGFLTAVAATILTARVGSASPDAGQLLELDAIAACVIGGTSLMGGRGSVFGAILGALVIESLNNGMSLANMESYWQYIIKGIVLVAAVWVDVATQNEPST